MKTKRTLTKMKDCSDKDCTAYNIPKGLKAHLCDNCVKDLKKQLKD